MANSNRFQFRSIAVRIRIRYFNVGPLEWRIQWQSIRCVIQTNDVCRRNGIASEDAIEIPFYAGIIVTGNARTIPMHRSTTDSHVRPGALVETKCVARFDFPEILSNEIRIFVAQ